MKERNYLSYHSRFLFQTLKSLKAYDSEECLFFYSLELSTLVNENGHIR